MPPVLLMAAGGRSFIPPIGVANGAADERLHATIDLGAGHRLLVWRSGDQLLVQVYRQAGARGIEDLGAVLASRVFPVDWPIDKVLSDAADAVAALGVQPPGGRT